MKHLRIFQNMAVGAVLLSDATGMLPLLLNFPRPPSPA